MSKVKMPEPVSYSYEQMQSYADQVRAETLLEAQEAAQIAVDTLRNNGKETEAFFAECCVDAIKRIMR